MNEKNKGKAALQLLLLVVLTELAGFLSSILSGNIREKYELMNKAPLSPPGEVFGIVWAVLYLLMALAFFMALHSDRATKSKRMLIWVLYVVQLALNVIWSPLFFGNNLKWAALSVILFMVIILFYTLTVYKKLSNIAFILLVPYFLWILFATYLNLSFALLN